MHNLEQIRAKNALEILGQKNFAKQEVNKFPALIANNGLLAAAAFAKDKGGALQEIMKSIVDHLNDKSVKVLTIKQGDNSGDAIMQMINELTNASSVKLQRASEEALAYISYLKRFAEKK